MTAGGSRVTVYAKSTAVAVTPVRPGKTYPLSVLDHAMARHALHLVFYYRPGSMDRDRLKDSLSDVLSHYPAVTGRLTRGAEDGNWVVKCNDAGVRVLDARAHVSLDEWLRSAHASEEMDLTHYEPMGDDPSIWSPFYVQITEFEDKAFAIGLSCTHMYADPTCAMLLVKAWGDAHRRACIANPPFFHPPGLRGRPTPNTDSKSAEHLASKSSSAGKTYHPKMSTATFRFTDQAVKNCLSEIQPICPDATPFDALSSLFWARIARAQDPSHVGTRTCTVCIDFRKLMHAPLPHGFFGNALHFSSVSADLEAGWGHVAKEMRGHVAGIEEEEYWSAIEWVESRMGETGTYPAAFRMYGPELTCVSMDHVFAYGAVFEEGRPVHVSCHVGNVEGEGVVMVLPGTEEGVGRTVMVTLPDDQTAKICKDDAILRHGPTVLFSGTG